MKKNNLKFPDIIWLDTITDSNFEEPKINNKVVEATTDFNNFVLKWLDEIDKDIDLMWIGEISTKNKEELIKIQENEKKFSLLLKHFEYLNEKFLKYIAKYPNNIDTIKNIFLNIWIIKTSSLHSKKTLENSIFSFFDKENLFWYENYISDLLKNWEWKKWFPKDIALSMFSIKKDFEKLFPKLTVAEVKKQEDPWNVWWKVR